MYQEQGLIYFKLNETDKALALLLEHCKDNLDDVIGMCRRFGIPEDQYWDPILKLAREENKLIPHMLNYVEVYRKPHRIMRAFG